MMKAPKEIRNKKPNKKIPKKFQKKMMMIPATLGGIEIFQKVQRGGNKRKK